MESQQYERFQEQLHLFQRFRNGQSNGLLYTKVLMAIRESVIPLLSTTYIEGIETRAQRKEVT